MIGVGAALGIAGGFLKQVNAAGIVIAAVVGFAAYMYGQNVGWNDCNDEWLARPPEVKLVDRPVTVHLDAIERDSLEAVISSKSVRLTQKDLEIRSARDLYADLAARLDSAEAGDTVDVPVATFEMTTVQNDYVYVEYHFPPINLFRNFRFVPGPREVILQDRYITITGPPERPSLFIKLVKVASYVVIAYGAATDQPAYIYGGAAGGLGFTLVF